MTEKTFAEKFPSLKGKVFKFNSDGGLTWDDTANLVSVYCVEGNCIDKKRLLEALIVAFEGDSCDPNFQYLVKKLGLEDEE